MCLVLRVWGRAHCEQVQSGRLCGKGQTLARLGKVERVEAVPGGEWQKSTGIFKAQWMSLENVIPKG